MVKRSADEAFSERPIRYFESPTTFQRLVRYGNYTGPNWSGGRYGPSRRIDRRLPVDELDETAQEHDRAYADGRDLASADYRFASQNIGRGARRTLYGSAVGLQGAARSLGILPNNVPPSKQIISSDEMFFSQVKGMSSGRRPRRKLKRKVSRMEKRIKRGGVSDRYVQKYIMYCKILTEWDRNSGLIYLPNNYNSAANPVTRQCPFVLFELTNYAQNLQDDQFFSYNLVKVDGGQGLDYYIWQPGVLASTAANGEAFGGSTTMLRPVLKRILNTQAQPVKEKAYLKDIFVKLEMFGQQSIDTIFRVDLVKFNFDDYHPGYYTGLSAGTEWLDYLGKWHADHPKTNPEQQRRDYWWHRAHEEMARRYMAHPGEKIINNNVDRLYPFRILKTWKYKLPEQDGDSEQLRSVVANLNIPVNKMIKYSAQSTSLPDLGDPSSIVQRGTYITNTHWGTTLNDEATDGNNQDYVFNNEPAYFAYGSAACCRARPSDRLYLMIRATNYKTGSTTSTAPTYTKGAAPTFNFTMSKSFLVPGFTPV